MKKLLTISSLNPAPLFSVLLYLTTGLLIFIHFFYSFSDFNLFVNSTNSPVQDSFYDKLTFMGNGVFVVGMALILLLKFRTLGIQILLTYGFSSLIVQTLKLTIFKGWPRPIEYFKDSVYNIHFVDGTNMALLNTFPSGHTTSAFLLSSLLAFHTSNKWTQLLLFLMASLVGYSRIYLMQHFLRDVLAGALIGYFCSVAVYYWFSRNKVMTEA